MVDDSQVRVKYEFQHRQAERTFKLDSMMPVQCPCKILIASDPIKNKQTQAGFIHPLMYHDAILGSLFHTRFGAAEPRRWRTQTIWRYRKHDLSSCFLRLTTPTQRAIELVKLAIIEDEKHNYADAYKIYQNALDYFMLAFKCKPAFAKKINH